ncbi:uncharacterized protein DUF664 [Haloactinopolyspora alba]|uniref:Uncharacterized protein DUF664 n=1 Tax=Haloactinopolyspora alba TaxID=648780 RepID=A0A2P8E5M9_9ACTN|nr:DUF664 domain-containing protein [Haloactinopolyspora alba]PSL04770.1 uncharacterized protein DUF664 [Haloactinopolyspora alba]
MSDTLPARDLADPRELLLAHLDRYRGTIARKLDGLTETELRTSRLPSGWTPLQLVNHLVHMERRWLRWGFAAEPVDEPWGDGDEHDRWTVPATATAHDLVAALHTGGAVGE